MYGAPKDDAKDYTILILLAVLVACIFTAVFRN